ncbi:MAG: hypothetical protein ACFFDH_16090 [Promethearchaeota archaeon]
MPGRKFKFQEKSKVLSFRVPESKADRFKQAIQQFIDNKTQEKEND